MLSVPRNARDRAMSAASDERQLMAGGARGGSDGCDPYEDVRAHTKRLRAGAWGPTHIHALRANVFSCAARSAAERRGGAAGCATTRRACSPLPRGLTRCDAPYPRPRVP